MLYGMLADLVLIVHMVFVLFVSLGAVAVLYRTRLALLHVPCLVYGSALEFVGWICPLTPLEQALRLRAGQEGYAGGFIEHYAGGLLYPAGWHSARIWLGAALVGFNLIAYAFLISRALRARRTG
jgi:hypothetical protein